MSTSSTDPTVPTGSTAPMGAATHELSPGALFGKYRIEARLGEGGMGVVYRAVDTRLDRTVAIKVLRAELARDRTFADRFQREARAAAKVADPRVVAIHEVDERDGCLFAAFEFVGGGDLGDRLARERRLPAAEALRIILECAHGLEAVHRAGLVHRDIKPQNIFIDAMGHPKLGDLGLARAQTGDDRLTLTGAAMGTPSYMAPEQAEGVADLDVRTDIHALGATLYALVTGKPPFTGQTPWAVVKNVMTEPPPDPCRVDPALPRGLAVVVQRCMAKDRNARFQTPAELIASLERLIAEPGAAVTPGAPAPVVPASPVQPAPWPPPSNARRWLVPALVVVVIALAVTLGVILGRGESRQEPHRVVDQPAPAASAPAVAAKPVAVPAPAPAPTVAPVAVAPKPAAGRTIELNRGRIATAATASGQRDVVAESLRTQINEQLGGRWLVLVLIPEVPDSTLNEGRDGWVWPRCSVTLLMVGDGSEPMPVAADALCQAVYEAIKDRVRQPTANLSVKSETSTDPKLFATVQVNAREVERAELARRDGSAQAEQERLKQLKKQEEMERVRRVLNVFPMLP